MQLQSPYEFLPLHRRISSTVKLAHDVLLFRSYHLKCQFVNDVLTQKSVNDVVTLISYWLLVMRIPNLYVA